MVALDQRRIMGFFSLSSLFSSAAATLQNDREFHKRKNQPNFARMQYVCSFVS